TLGGTAGLTSLSGKGTASLSFDGSPADVTAALSGLVYAPAADYTGPDLLTLSATNPGGSGLSGGPKTATATVALTVTPTADSPACTLAGSNISVFDAAGPQALPGWAKNVKGEPPNTGDLTGLSFTATSDNPGLFAAQPQVTLTGHTGTLTFTPALYAEGVAH